MALPCSSAAVLRTASPPSAYLQYTSSLRMAYIFFISNGSPREERAKTGSLLKPERLVHRAHTTHRYSTSGCQVAYECDPSHSADTPSCIRIRFNIETGFARQIIGSSPISVKLHHHCGNFSALQQVSSVIIQSVSQVLSSIYKVEFLVRQKMTEKKRVPKQDSLTEMMKRIFAVANLVIQTDGYQEIYQSAKDLRTKTQKQ